MTVAFSAQKSKLHISGSPAGTKTITGVQLSNPVIVTASAHGMSPGDVVTLADVGGTTQLNGVTAVVQYVTANTVALANINGADMTAYTSGGTLTPLSWTQIKGLKSFNGFDGQANELDATDLDSDAEEILLGIKRFGNFTIELNRSFDDPGQLALVAAFNSKAVRTYRLTLPNGATKTFSAYVRTDPLQGATDGLVTASVALRITGNVVTGG